MTVSYHHFQELFQLIRIPQFSIYEPISASADKLYSVEDKRLSD